MPKYLPETRRFEVQSSERGASPTHNAAWLAAGWLFTISASMPSAANDARTIKDAAADTTAAAAIAASPYCALYTPAEATAYAGVTLDDIGLAGGNTGCEWVTKNGSAKVMVQVTPLRYAQQPSLAPSFRKLPDLGKGGYVAQDLGGWVAGTSTLKEFILVALKGPKANDAQVIALLTETVKRRQ